MAGAPLWRCPQPCTGAGLLVLLLVVGLLGVRGAEAAQRHLQQSDSSSAAGGGTGGDAPMVTGADLVLLHGVLVFFMQVGFVSAEAGAGRAKNVRNILLKNLVNVMLCALCWWAVGYAFAYGRTAGGVIGASNFFAGGDMGSSRAKPWFFSWTFALSTVTITSGCLAERTHLFAYPLYTTVTAMLVHPVVAHWAWARDSWLATSVGGDCRFLDFAGGAVVHIVGGVMGLIGAKLCGPRLGRFEEGNATHNKELLPGHDVSSYSIGTFMLWFGWFGFNCGSVYLYMGGTGAAAAATSAAVNRVAVNMTLSASASGVTALIVCSARTGTFDLQLCCNGLLAGLSASTAITGFVQPWAAALTGVLAGLLYVANRKLLIYCEIDDPLDSSAIHAGSGLLGCLVIGFLAQPSYVAEMTGRMCGGVVYGKHGGLQLGLQLLGVSVTIAWTAAWSLLIFGSLKRLNLLRVDQQTELAGIDNMEHGGPAYPEFVSRVVSRS